MTVIRSSRAYWARCVLAVLVLAVPAVVMLALAPTAGAQPPAPQDVAVPIRDFAFSAADLTVHTGDSVTWANGDRAPHDVTATSGPASFASGPLKQGQSFSYTFGAAGTYSYMCTIHPDMVATVTAMDHPAAAAAPAEEVAPVPEEVPAEGAPAPEVPADQAAGDPVAGDPAAGEPAGGAVAAAPGAPPAGTSVAAVPVAPGGAQLAPGATQVVGAASQGQQLDPLLIIAGIALGVTTLCLLLVSAQPTGSLATVSSGAGVGGTRRPGIVTMTSPRHRERGPVNLLLPLRVLVAAGLAVDAYVHFNLAADYDAVGGLITQGTLFRGQAAAAGLAALLILLVGRTWVYQVAFLVAVSGLGPLLLYTYVDVGALGPMPNMYEPVWYADKVFSAIGEAVSAMAAAGLLALAWRSRGQSPASAGTGQGR